MGMTKLLGIDCQAYISSHDLDARAQLTCRSSAVLAILFSQIFAKKKYKSKASPATYMGF